MTALAACVSLGSHADRIRAIAGAVPAIAAAVELVDRNDHPWDAAMESLVLVLAEENARLRADLAAERTARGPAVFALPATDDDGACLGCAENPCTGAHP